MATNVCVAAGEGFTVGPAVSLGDLVTLSRRRVHVIGAQSHEQRYQPPHDTSRHQKRRS